MKRLDAEPSKEAILESIGSDAVSRNADVISFCKLLDETEGPFSYMLDAPWGSGKTFFVKSVEMVLKSNNPKLFIGDADYPELGGVVRELGESASDILPYYFNAWENDFADDPVAALFASMVATFEREDLLNLTNFNSAVVEVIDASLAARGIPLKMSGAYSALTGTTLVAEYKKRATIRSRVNDVAKSSISHVASKLVIFIDELDRCRPDFAVRLLEQTKSLFQSPNIVLVFSADCCQLAKAVGGAYGPGFNATKFLERFFDERVLMAPVDAFSFANSEYTLDTGYKFDKLVREIVASHPMTIREAFRVKSKLNDARTYCMKGIGGGGVHAFAACAVLPLLVFLEHDDIDLFHAVTSGSDFGALYDYGSEYRSFLEIAASCYMHGRSILPLNERPDDEECRMYVHRICAIMFGAYGNPDRSAAEEHLGVYAREFDSKVYRTLKFD